MAESSPSSSSTTTSYPLIISHLTIGALWLAAQYVYIPYPVHLLTLVTAILVVGCHQSLILAPAVDEKLQQLEHQSTSTGKQSGSQNYVSEPRETLRKEDAYQFPLVGSCALFSLVCPISWLQGGCLEM